MVDAEAMARLRWSAMSSPLYLAHLRLCSAHGAGAWVIAPPADKERRADGHVFRTMLKRRLRVAIFAQLFQCPACHDVMELYGDHALVCMCWGDRTRRHNRLRDIIYADATAGGLGCVKEKRGLLLRRPDPLKDECDDGVDATEDWTEVATEDTSLTANFSDSSLEDKLRRPGDVFFTNLVGVGATCLDIAVTSGIQRSMLEGSIDNSSYAVEVYEEAKRRFQPDNATASTDAMCKANNITFEPQVFEAHGGGFGPRVFEVLGYLAKGLAETTGHKPDHNSRYLAQRLSFSLHSSCAQMVIDRSDRFVAEDQEWLADTA